MNIEQLKRHIQKSDLTALEKRYLEGLVDARTPREGMRLIDADALKEVFEENIADCKMQLRHADLFEEDLIYLEAEKETYECVVYEIDDTPTIEAEPVRHGRWISDEADILFHCSKCGVQISTSWDYKDLQWNYCPDCGAKMDGGENK